MDDLAMKALYGPEYPEAIMISGVRIPLERETRFARHYYSKDGKAGGSVSKFQDGTVALTLQQLQNEWSEWSKQERQGFCSECSWLGAQSDFPDMLRFIMRHGEPDHWRDIALCVAHHLPQDEAYQILLAALRNIESHTANISQAIAETKHPEATPILTELLRNLWAHPNLSEDADFTNWLAFDALCCVQHLLMLGIPPSEFEEKVRLLSQHRCSNNRECCTNYLHDYYKWLPKPNLPPLPNPAMQRTG